MPNLTPKYFDEEYYEGGKGYHTYNDDPRFQVWAEDIITKYGPESVLDFGCAKGYLVKALRDRGVKAYGFDVSEWAIGQAPKSVKPYLSSFIVPEVDLIISYDTWEHIPENELVNYKHLLEDNAKQFFFTVGTLNTPNWEHDASHITMKELSFWQDFWPEAEWVESK